MTVREVEVPVDLMFGLRFGDRASRDLLFAQDWAERAATKLGSHWWEKKFVPSPVTFYDDTNDTVFQPPADTVEYWRCRNCFAFLTPDVQLSQLRSTCRSTRTRPPNLSGSPVLAILCYECCLHGHINCAAHGPTHGP